MNLDTILFYLLSAFLLLTAFKTITASNPLHSALYLALTMIGLGGMFYTLNAQFIAGVQVIVYAGAVMVLFVMVLMLFDVEHELRAFVKGAVSGLLKIMSAALLAGMVIGTVRVTTDFVDPAELGESLAKNPNVTKDLAILLYSKYLFSFELLGVLLLVIAVGVVAVSRVKGGTHAKH